MENLTTNVQIACQKSGATTYSGHFPGDIGQVLIDGSELTAKVIWELYLLGRSYLGL